ncbi:hypothetical protein H5410_003916 [Solanum commersonii]|uniref:DUF4283 domain-containing protein n=1 Tax=Solanum commersonii TaxID=4109 RepID=A0A9J6B701_SOLCO|nr:hypothetical protein H5410_003916 [Solanum commersonii]
MENTIYFAVGFKSYELLGIVRRWKIRENFSKTFYARNFNKYGRSIIIINLKGKRRSVLIIPELTLNSGWTFLAEKVDRSSKWSSRDKRFINADPINTDSMLKKSGGGINDVDVASMFTKEGLLKRSLVGKFENRVNVPLTLAEIRKWSSNTWKQSHGLNIYEWAVKCSFSSLPSGTWQSKNHLKWVRIKVCEDGRDIPKEVTVVNNKILFSMQIWADSLVRVVVETPSCSNLDIQRSIGKEPKELGQHISNNFASGSRPRENATTHGETWGSIPLRGTWACASKCIHNCRSPRNSAKGKDPMKLQRSDGDQNSSIQVSRGMKGLGVGGHTSNDYKGNCGGASQSKIVEKNMQLQQVHDAKPVATLTVGGLLWIRMNKGKLLQRKEARELGKTS